MSGVTIEPLPSVASGNPELVVLLKDAVTAGASIGFLAGLTTDEAAEYWQRVAADCAAGSRMVWVARDPASDRIVGSIQLGLERRRNGRHRAEVQKLTVLKSWRRRGIGTALIRVLEKAAGQKSISLLFLDTSDGPGGARDFYAAMGYTYVGGIPGYALDPDGTPRKNAIYYKPVPQLARR